MILKGEMMITIKYLVISSCIAFAAFAAGYIVGDDFGSSSCDSIAADKVKVAVEKATKEKCNGNLEVPIAVCYGFDEKNGQLKRVRVDDDGRVFASPKEFIPLMTETQK